MKKIWDIRSELQGLPYGLIGMQPRIKSILKIVLSGGDADTNAAVAGAILGAKFGICHIPDEWRNGLLYASMLHNKVQEFYAMYR